MEGLWKVLGDIISELMWFFISTIVIGGTLFTFITPIAFVIFWNAGIILPILRGCLLFGMVWTVACVLIEAVR
jgi:hypothetical protein